MSEKLQYKVSGLAELIQWFPATGRKGLASLFLAFFSLTLS